MSLSADQRNTIKLLKGAPLTVLLVMGLLGGQAGEKHLCRETGYSNKTVQKALETLKDTKLVTRTHRYNGWVLTNGGRQMLLSSREQPVDNLDSGDDRVGEFPTPTSGVVKIPTPAEKRVGISPTPQDERVVKIPTPEENESETFLLPEERVGKIPTPATGVVKIPTPGPTTTTLTNTKRSKDLKYLKDSSSSSSENESETFPLPEIEREVDKALKAAGIGKRTRSQLAALPHISPEYVQAHANAHEQETNPRRRTIGLLICKLRDGDPVPKPTTEDWKNRSLGNWEDYVEDYEED